VLKNKLEVAELLELFGSVTSEVPPRFPLFWLKIAMENFSKMCEEVGFDETGGYIVFAKNPEKIVVHLAECLLGYMRVKYCEYKVDQISRRNSFSSPNISFAGVQNMYQLAQTELASAVEETEKACNLWKNYSLEG
jgi:hypothetical protein